MPVQRATAKPKMNPSNLTIAEWADKYIVGTVDHFLSAPSPTLRGTTPRFVIADELDPPQEEYMALLNTLDLLQREVTKLVDKRPGASRVRAGLLAAQLFTEIHADEPKAAEPTYTWACINNEMWMARCSTILPDPLPDFVDVQAINGRITRHEVLGPWDHDTLQVNMQAEPGAPALSFSWRSVAGEWMAHCNMYLVNKPDEVTITRQDGHSTRHKVIERYDSFLFRVEQFPISEIGADWSHDADRSTTIYKGHFIIVARNNKKWAYDIFCKSGKRHQSGHHNHRPAAIAAAERYLKHNC